MGLAATEAGGCICVDIRESVDLPRAAPQRPSSSTQARAAGAQALGAHVLQGNPGSRAFIMPAEVHHPAARHGQAYAQGGPPSRASISRAKAVAKAVPVGAATAAMLAGVMLSRRARHTLT
jgi:hypothetical protein